MSLNNLHFKHMLNTSDYDLSKDFFIPLLKNSNIYYRGIGYFSAAWIKYNSEGIMHFVENGGKIRWITSPVLRKEDWEHILKGEEAKVNEILKASLNEVVTDLEKSLDESLLLTFSWMIADGIIEIKLAKPCNALSGEFHDKFGYFEDEDGNCLSFNGSNNESINGIRNYESISVYSSSDQSESLREYSGAAKERFKRLWNNEDENVRTFDIPSSVKENIINLRKNNDRPYNTDKYPLLNKDTGPKIPKNIILRNYQQEAISKWEENNFVGIYDMATGTGKTYTALASCVKLYQKNKRIAIIIVCPLQHLVEQWASDVKEFNMNPIIAYSKSSQKKWDSHLKNRIISYNRNYVNHFVCIVTNATYITTRFQTLIKKILREKLIVVDEAHNFGAAKLSKYLDLSYQYRLALSATIVRHRDEDGTNSLFNYFNKIVYSFSLREAIEQNMLVKYNYYPIVVTLQDNEIKKYREITKKITQLAHLKNSNEKSSDIDKKINMQLLKRSRIVAGARNKLSAFFKEIEKYKGESHTLVYCGAVSYLDEDYQEDISSKEEIRQIDEVTRFLGNELGMKVARFTAYEEVIQRKNIIEDFSQGNKIRTLVAIRCLDEGVNIPSIKNAFILASSTNPKEYIQRRGRLLRKSPNKKYANIIDFITLPIDVNTTKLYKYNDGSFNSLVKREIDRMNDFYKLCKNKAESKILINKITRFFGIKDVLNGKG